MKKKYSHNISKKLIKYGAFSTAVLSAAAVNAQIEYTDIPDVTINSGESYDLDLNQDGTGDYVFIVNNNGNFAFVITANSSAATQYNSNAFVGSFNDPYNYPSNLASGAVINSNQNFVSNARGDLNYNSCAYSGSQFCGGQEGFMGLKINVSGNEHFGWARIEVAADASSITFKDFALNLTPNDEIEAGQQTLSLKKESFNGFTYFTNNDKLHLSANSTIETAKVYNLTGKLISETHINSLNGSFDISKLPSDIYLAEITINGFSQTIKFNK